MNAPEQLAGAYLRLNGFFLLPNFTVFDGHQHTDIDIVALRAPGAVEKVGDTPLPQDQQLNDALSDDGKLLALVVQVKGNSQKAFPPPAHLEYTRPLVGAGTRMLACRFSTADAAPTISHEGLSIGLPHALHWVQGRIAWMDMKENLSRLTKTPSWSWSEPFLQSLLVLRACTKDAPSDQLEQILSDAERTSDDNGHG